jgi:DNA-directed RNA polymerase subunit RPC12/RpoP
MDMPGSARIPTPMTYNCAHCGEKLTSSPESDAGDWIIRCLSCGARHR